MIFIRVYGSGGVGNNLVMMGSIHRVLLRILILVHEQLALDIGNPPKSGMKSQVSTLNVLAKIIYMAWHRYRIVIASPSLTVGLNLPPYLCREDA